MTEDDESDQTDHSGAIETVRLVLLPLHSPNTAVASVFEGAELAQEVDALSRMAPGTASSAFAIVEANSRKPVGAAAYGPMFERPQLTEIGCWISASHRGIGYATEAAQAVIDRAFTDATITILWCANRVMNVGARRVIEKCGFQYRESGMARSPNSKGAVPVDRFALDRRTWVALHRWGERPQRGQHNGEPHGTIA